MTNPQANTPGLLPDVPEYTAQIIHLWVTEESVRILTRQQQPLELLQQHLMQSDPLRQGLMKELLSEESVAQILSGQHAPVTKQLLAECEAIHKKVSQDEHNIVYQGCYILVLPTIVAFRAKEPRAKEMGEIEILCTILYNATVRGLTKESGEGAEESPLDTRIYQQISALFALLDQEYHRKHHKEETHSYHKEETQS